MSDLGSIEHGQSQDSARYVELISRLPGVFAANVRFGYEGDPCEVHVLASSARNPKQLGRDIQSALFAAFGTWVDHRIISIAQITGDPIRDSYETTIPTDTAIRLKYKGFSSHVEDDVYSICVTLRYANEDYIGEATCKNSEFQRPRAVVRATLEAVHQFLGCGELFGMITIQSVHVSGWKVMVAILEYLDDASGHLLVGAAQFTDNEALSAIRSTLDALNRLFSKLATARV